MEPMAKKTKKSAPEEKPAGITKTKQGEKKKRKHVTEEMGEEEPRGGFLPELRLHPETKKSIWAVILFGVAAILFLASFQSAGPAGSFLFGIFQSLFGWGYYLLPLILIVMGGVFLTSERRKIYGITFFGAGLFVLSGLGLIDVVSPGNGGCIYIGDNIIIDHFFFGNA
jgi:hypothetical protein